MLFPSVGRNDMKYSLFHKPLGGVEPKAAHAHSQLNTSLCNRAAGDEPTLNVTTPCNGRSYQEFILGVLLMCVNDGIHSQRTYGGLMLWLIVVYGNNVCAVACICKCELPQMLACILLTVHWTSKIFKQR